MPVRALSVSVQTFRAERQEAVGLALGERRIGEQRGGDRLQRQRHAELLHHVGFAAKSRLACTVQVRNIMSRPSEPTFGM
jgi:hypothetical protein